LDFDFWTDESKPKELKTFIKNFFLNRDPPHFIKDGAGPFIVPTMAMALIRSFL
jgi:hypothetical protein